MTNTKLIFRILWKNRIGTLVNIVGFSLGLATFFLLSLFVKNELAYDKQFSDYDKIFRITTSINTPDGSQKLAFAPMPLKNILKENYPEVAEAGIIVELPDRDFLKYKDVCFRQDDMREASSDFLSVLDYKVVDGDLSTALNEPNSLVLTESVAKSLMGEEMAINKQIMVGDEAFNLTAILKDLPSNMDLQFKGLYPGYREIGDDMLDFDGFLYVKTLTGDRQKLLYILKEIEQTYYEPMKDALEGIEIKLDAQPIQEIHFSSELLADSPKGDIKYVYFFSIVGVVILLIACFNYINLANAGFNEKSYLQGVCRINGAGTYRTFLSNIQESAMVIMSGYLLSVILLMVFLPFFNAFSNKNIDWQNIFNLDFFWITILTLIAILVIVNLLPYLFTSLYKFQGGQVSQLGKNGNTKNFRGGIVIVQFLFTIILMVGMLTFQRQLNFMKEKDLGFDLHNVMIVETPDDTAYYSKLMEYKDLLSNYPEVKRISKIWGGAIPGVLYGGGKMIHAAEIDGEMKQFIVSFMDVDEHYMDLLGMELIKGEAFKLSEAENAGKCIVNETYAKAMGFENDIIGKPIPEGDLKVSGVVKDFHFLSPQNPIEPICIRNWTGYPPALMIKGDRDALKKAKLLWKGLFPNQIFLYSLVEDTYNRQYLGDIRNFKIIMAFTLLSIFISVLGMVGLVQYTCEKKIKNIGIRKVCGANIKEILIHFNVGFVKQIALAMIIGSPVAFFIMDNWLERFAFKIEITPFEFILSGLTIFAITFTFVSWVSWKAAIKNPVEALRYE